MVAKVVGTNVATEVPTQYPAERVGAILDFQRPPAPLRHGPGFGPGFGPVLGFALAN